MGIAYLNGARLKAGVIAAAQRILDVQERLNAINVFPVPDGDTGTNMALTMKSVADGAINAGDLALAPMTSNLAESALMGARGNSGAILAQFFQGLAEAFGEKNKVGPDDFATGVGTAVSRAEQAIENPTEGTILSVMRSWARHLEDYRHQATDLAELLKSAFSVAVHALERTPKQLAVLEKAGVVDAGAQGFVDMLDGINRYLDTGELSEWLPRVVDQRDLSEMTLSTEDIPFGYCTECLVEGEGLNRNAIKAAISELGNSMIVAGSAKKVRIHIHTDEPERLFEIARSFGTVSRTKADDMRAQHRDHVSKQGDIALITDSSCDLPSEWLITHGVRVVPVNLAVGDRVYLDRVEITSREIYRLMAETNEPISTSQPSPGAFAKTYAMAAEKYRQGLALYVSGALSGTHAAGVAAAKLQDELELEVIDTRGIAGMVGLLVQVAAEAISEGCDLAEVKRRVLAAREHTHIFVSLQSLDYMIRSGRVKNWQGRIAKWLNLVPIISLNKKGAAKPCGKAKPGLQARKKVMKLVAKQARGLRDLRFLICHAGAPEDAAWYETALCETYGLDGVDILEVSPTIGVHVGLGTAAVTMLGFPEGGGSSST